MTIEKLNEAYDKLKDNFSSFFHTCLWRVCVDNITNGKVACFVSNWTEHGLRLGIAIANEYGYIPCPCYFKEGTKHDRGQEVLEELNRIIFGLNDEAAMLIVTSSMRKPSIEDEEDINATFHGLSEVDYYN